MAIEIHQVEVLIAVEIGRRIDEDIIADKMDALIRLHPGIVFLFQKGFEEFPVKGIV